MSRILVVYGTTDSHTALGILQHEAAVDRELAPPEAVWPWLAQLGHNVHEVRPEWQTRRTGDLVPATQPSSCPHFIMQRRMMLTIKALAERDA